MDRFGPNSFAFISTIAIVMPTYAVDYLTEAQAQKVLFPDTAFLKKNIELTEEQLSKIKELSGVRQRTKSPIIFSAQKKNQTIGTFFVDEVIGKHEFITYAVGVDPKGTLIGVEIMSYRETHGGEIRNDSWRNNFKGKSISDPFKLDVDVPNITGATLSCRNVLDGTKRILVLWKELSNAKLL